MSANTARMSACATVKSYVMSKISRREFVETTGAGIVIATGVPLAAQEAPPSGPRTTVKLTVNGVEHRTEVEDHWTLVEMLRDHLRLTGTKIGCDRGECGACTVLAGRQAGLLVQPACGVGRRPVDHHRRRLGARWPSASAARSFHRARRAAVRLLYFRPVDERQGAARSQSASHSR